MKKTFLFRNIGGGSTWTMTQLTPLSLIYNIACDLGQTFSNIQPAGTAGIIQTNC